MIVALAGIEGAPATRQPRLREPKGFRIRVGWLNQKWICHSGPLDAISWRWRAIFDNERARWEVLRSFKYGMDVTASGGPQLVATPIDCGTESMMKVMALSERCEGRFMPGFP